MPSAAAIPGLEVELVREPRQLRQFEDTWRELALERGNAFVTPEWFWAWHRHYGSEGEPLVGVVRDSSGTLQGLLPLVVATGGRSRTARFAASGLGDHFHPVASADDEAVVAAAVGGVLRSESRSWKSLVLENIDTDGTWWKDFSASSGCARNPLVDQRSILLSVRLAGRSWEEYLASRSRNLRSQLGRKRRALEREHNVALRWTTAGDDIASEMETLFRLHDMRWESRPDSSALTSERARAFHLDFATAARARGWLRLAFLEIDSKPVAGWYGWRLGERFAYYQAGFDPAWSESSVGLLLFSDTIRAAAEEAAFEYDMLLGNEEFKSRFADSERAVCTAVLAPWMQPTRLLAATEIGLRRAGRRLPDRVGQPAKRRAGSFLARLPLARRR